MTKNSTPNTEEIKEGLSSIFSAISDKLSSEQKELYLKLVPERMKEEIELKGGIQGISPEKFFFTFLYPFDNFIEGMLQTNGVTNQDVVFIFQNSQFVERHFRYFIEKIDGRAYSADRSRTIIKALVATFSTGEDISFNYEQEYTYHLPEKVFRTHQDIIEFYQGVKNLFYGNPDKYLLAVKKIYQGLQEKK